MGNKKLFSVKRMAVLLSVMLLGAMAGVAVASAESLTALTLQASTAADLDSPFKTVYGNVNESVVGIELMSQTYVRNGRISVDTSFVASGVVIGNETVITNYHVVTGGRGSNNVAEGINIVYKGERYPAEYVAGDEESDVAILTVKDLAAPAVPLGNSEELSVGDWALVIGNPLGEEFINTLTVGVVSGLNRDVKSSGITMIQTNAQINKGNSGGGLFNIRGELVGITSMKMSGMGYFGASSIEGLGFAIPINTVSKVADDLIRYGQVVYPRLGVQVNNIISVSDEPTKDSLPASIWVVKVEESSPAGEVGIQTDDLIMEVDGQRVRTYDDLQEILRQHQEGDVISVTVYRVPNVRNIKAEENIPEGEFLTFDVTLKIMEKIDD